MRHTLPYVPRIHKFKVSFAAREKTNADMTLKTNFLFLCICVLCVVLLITLTERVSQPNYYNQTELSVLPEYANRPFLVKYIIEPSCDSSFLIWLITSSVEDSSLRLALRRAYPTEELESRGVQRVFLLGRSRKNVYLRQKLIDEESLRFKDILQGDFADVYRNLTRKHLMGLQWAISRCKASFLAKMDDDIVVDLFRILELLHGDLTEEYSLSGYALRKMLPIRSKENKWFVTKDEFAETIYPDFVSGWFYVTRLQTVERLVSASEDFQEPFWIDDVFVTGILREKSNITIKELNEIYATDYRFLECCLRDESKRYKCDFIVGPDGGKKNLQMKFRKFAESCRNCPERSQEFSIKNTCVSKYEENFNPKNGIAFIYPVRNL